MQKLQVNFNSGPLISVIMNCYNGDKYLENFNSKHTIFRDVYETAQARKVIIQ